jgi:hypothetical protein
MNNKYCEKLRLSAMAILDGEAPQLSAKEINDHLESCAACRSELEQERQVMELLNRQSRGLFTDDICSRVAVIVRESKAGLQARQELCPLILLGLILLAYKIIELLPGLTPGPVIKLMPVLAVFVIFALLKQNPFKIDQNLRFEGDIR